MRDIIDGKGIARASQRGHATAETIVALLALAPFLVGIPLLGKQLDVKQKTYDAARYAVWERTVYRSDGAQKSDADITIEGRDRTLGNARAGLAMAASLRSGGITENVLWRDRAGQRLLTQSRNANNQPVAFGHGSRNSPVEIGRVTVPQIAYRGGAAAAMSVVGVQPLGFNPRSFATANVSAQLRPTLGILADEPFALRPSRQRSNRAPVVQSARSGILSDTWSPPNESTLRRRIDDLVPNERMWLFEMPGMALGFLGGKGTPLYGEGQFGFGRSYTRGPDFTVPSTSVPGPYVYRPQRR
jgi:hypothetical protein